MASDSIDKSEFKPVQAIEEEIKEETRPSKDDFSSIEVVKRLEN